MGGIDGGIVEGFHVLMLVYCALSDVYMVLCKQVWIYALNSQERAGFRVSFGSGL